MSNIDEDKFQEINPEFYLTEEKPTEDPIDEPLDEVLKLISITTPITFKEERRTSDKDGIYQKRKVILRINKLKINQFK